MRIQSMTMPGHKSGVFLIKAICLSSVLIICGCASIGPPNLTRDRFDYHAAISESWKRQTLTNIVKVRFGETPVLLDVTSVISAYSVSGSVQASSQFGNQIPTFNSVDAVGQYVDAPTVTFAPITGERFARYMIQPLPLVGVLALLQEGYEADAAARLCMSSINGFRNDFRPVNAGDPRFRELAELLRGVQTESGLTFEKRQKDGLVYFVLKKMSSEESVAWRKLLEFLALEAQTSELSVAYGSGRLANTDITIATRSVMQLMLDLAAQIQVSSADASEGRVFMPTTTSEQERLFPTSFRVLNSPEPPDNAYVAIPYRGSWFWIDDRDVQSKHLLGFINILYTLTETDGPSSAPVVTIPIR